MRTTAHRPQRTTHTHTYTQMPEHKAAGWKTPIWDEYRRLVSEAEAEARGGKPVELVEVGVGWGGRLAGWLLWAGVRSALRVNARG